MSSGLLSAFVAEVGLITFRAYRGGGASAIGQPGGGGLAVPSQAPLPAPLPAEYTAPIVIYALLAVIPDAGQRVAGLIGWGLVLATALDLFVTGGAVKQVATASPATTPGTTKAQVI